MIVVVAPEGLVQDTIPAMFGPLEKVTFKLEGGLASIDKFDFARFNLQSAKQRCSPLINNLLPITIESYAVIPGMNLVALH